MMGVDGFGWILRVIRGRRMAGLIAGRPISRSGYSIDWISAIARRRPHHHGRWGSGGGEVFVVILIGAHAAVLGRSKDGGTRGSDAAHPVVVGGG